MHGSPCGGPMLQAVGCPQYQAMLGNVVPILTQGNFAALGTVRTLRRACTQAALPVDLFPLLRGLVDTDSAMLLNFRAPSAVQAHSCGWRSPPGRQGRGGTAVASSSGGSAASLQLWPQQRRSPSASQVGPCIFLNCLYSTGVVLWCLEIILGLACWWLLLLLCSAVDACRHICQATAAPHSLVYHPT